jgi:hypothetical protein
MDCNGKMLYTLIKVCCVCNKLMSADAYERKNDGRYVDISHGYCPVCFEAEMLKLDKELKDNRQYV